MKKNVYLVMTDFDDYYAFNDHDNAFEKAHSLLDCNGTVVSVREVEIEDADDEPVEEDHAPVEASLPETEEQDDEDEKDDEEVDAVQVLADLLNFVNFLHWLQDKEEK